MEASAVGNPSSGAKFPIFSVKEEYRGSTDSKITDLRASQSSDEDYSTKELSPRRNLSKENTQLRTEIETLKTTIETLKITSGTLEGTIDGLRTQLLPFTEASKEDITSPTAKKVYQVFEQLQMVKGSWAGIFNDIQELNNDIEPFLLKPQSLLLGSYAARFFRSYDAYRLQNYVNNYFSIQHQTTLTDAKKFLIALKTVSSSRILTAMEAQIAGCEKEIQVVRELSGKVSAEFTEASANLYAIYDAQNPVNRVYALIRANPYTFSPSAVCTKEELERELLD